jgi:hypothetical protein
MGVTENLLAYYNSSVYMHLMRHLDTLRTIPHSQKAQQEVVDLMRIVEASEKEGGYFPPIPGLPTEEEKPNA